MKWTNKYKSEKPKETRKILVGNKTITTVGIFVFTVFDGILFFTKTV